MRKTVVIAASVTCAVVVAAGLSVLIWWLVTRENDPYSVNELEGDGIGSLPYSAAFTKIRGVGDVFWWFYPSVALAPASRPLVLWLDGLTGVSPSILANLVMVGPYDANFIQRNNSWINHCNLLFVDAPLGTGYSKPLDNSKIPKTVDENVEHLLIVLESFYSTHEEYKSAPLYIFGQADGAKSAVVLATKLYELKQSETEHELKDNNIRGIAVGNGIISPALTLTKLGFYLEKMGYIDGRDRTAIDEFTEETIGFVRNGNMEAAFDNFFILNDFVNQNTSAVALNLDNIVEKLTRSSTTNRDVWGPSGFNTLVHQVGVALGMDEPIYHDGDRQTARQAARHSFMTPFTNKIEHILQSTDLTVSIYNGNLDAVSNTPGQLLWVDTLQWPNQTDFNNSPRETLVVNRLLEGYFRETQRLKFYWINAAGQWAPLDNPEAMTTILQRMIQT